MQRVDRVNHELKQPVSKVTARVKDGDGGVASTALAGHHARHGRARDARLRKKGNVL